MRINRTAWARAVAGLAVAGLGLAACGGAASSGEDRVAEAAPSPAVSSPASELPTELPTPQPADVEAAPVDDRVQARLEMSGGPDWLATAAGSLWVKKDDGTVVRLDPDGNDEVAAIDVAEALCQGIGADDEAVWSCSDDGAVVRIDPATDEVAATVDVRKIADQGQIPVAFGRAWLLVGDGSTLVGITDDAVDVEVDLGTRCTELTASGTAIWAACPIDGFAVAVDPDAGAITTRTPGLDDARTIAVGDDVWVGFAGGLARIDESSGRVTGVADAPSGLGGGIAATSDDVWVRTGGRFLRRVDARTLEVVEDLEAPEASGGSVLLAFGSIWATAYDDDVLYRITP